VNTETSAPPAVAPARAAALPSRSPRSPLRLALASVRRDRAAVLGIALFLLIVGMAVCAQFIAPYGPTKVQIRDRLQLPSRAHLLGTDELGRDLLSRIIFGARVSLAVGIIAVGIAAAFGVPLGLLAAYYGGLVDSTIMRALDGLLAFPSLILALAIMTVLGPNLTNVMIAIGVVTIPSFARITRGSVLSLKEKEFVESARAIGATDPYVMFRVLLPNCLSPLLVQVSISFAGAILTEAALSFLGLGIQAPTPSWGAMLDSGRKYLDQTPWYSFSAGAAIFLAVLSLNLLGDGVRDALDPRLQGRQ
jgi:peptide/nickel transport system permease protein